jgi:hypothetical protein
MLMFLVSYQNSNLSSIQASSSFSHLLLAEYDFMEIFNLGLSLHWCFGTKKQI